MYKGIERKGEMKISTKGIYGLEALLDLAIHSDGEHINIKSIADRQGIPEKYLEQIFGTLKKGGIIKSVRGAQGGYFLGTEADQITVRQILNTLEGPLSPVACVSEGQEGTCNRYDFCVTRIFWRRMMEELNRVTDAVTLADLVECYQKDNTENNIEYYI
jgi:Rrf2 family transcriptional regulator, cysteine metabolism repressor